MILSLADMGTYLPFVLGVPLVTNEMKEQPTVILSGWHLDKRVPISIILALIAQTVAGAMWVGALNQRVEQTERWIQENRDLTSEIGVLNERTTLVLSALARIDARLDKLTDGATK